MLHRRTSIGTFSIFSLLVMVSFLGFPLSLPGQRQQVKVERISTHKKLSAQSIHCIIQDRGGFLWVGTGDGLNRYNGYDFTIFQHNAFDDNTISGNFILALCEDRQGMLWIGTRNGGLNQFDRQSETFRHFMPDAVDPGSISDYYISAIRQDSQGILWVGTVRGGLNRLDLVTLEFTRFVHDPVDPKSIGHNSVLCICEDRSGWLWVGTNGGGLNRLDRKTGQFARFQYDANDPNSLSSNSVWSIFEDRNDTLWVGTSAGLNRLIRQENRFIRYVHEARNPLSLSHNLVSAIAEDDEGRLWIGTGEINFVGDGLNIFDLKAKTFQRCPLPTDGNGQRVSVFRIFKDRVGTMWIGTIGEGLFKYDPHKYKFNHIKRESHTANTLSGERVWAIIEDRDGNLWIGMEEGGLNFLNRKTNRYTWYMHDPQDAHSLIDNSVRAILEDRQGMIWLGTDQGLDRFDRKRGHFVHYLTNAGMQDELGQLKISSLLEDRSGSLWVGTWGKGVIKLDKETGRFIHYYDDPGNPHSLSGSKITALYEDLQGNLWLGTISKGLNRFDARTGRFTHYQKGSSDRRGLSSNTVMSIHQDRPGRLWIGTWAGGLNRLDTSSGIFTSYSQVRGLIPRSIYGILGDSKGCLWMSTNSGMFKFDPHTETFTNYTEEDGLQSNEFNQGAYYRSKSGEMFFGGLKGFNSFSPEEVSPNPNIPRMVLLDFKIFGKSIREGQQNRLQYINPEEISIRLNHKENHFSFEFAALEYTNPQNNQYAYMMEGVDRDWLYCGTRRYANYTNLDAGDYVFRVIGSNNDGLWNRQGIAVYITIVPPFWKTWWFRVLVLLVLVSGLFLLFYARTKKLKEEISRQEQVQRTLKESRDDLQKAKEIIEFRHAETVKLVSAIPSILIAIDERGRIYQWNRPAEKFFNIPSAEIIGRDFTDSLEYCIKKAELAAILQAGMNQSTDSQREIQVNFKGYRHLLSVIINPIVKKQGEKRGLLLLCEDITQRRTEESRKNMLMKLKSVGQLHAGISHEINTPLQSIQFNSRLIANVFSDLVKFKDECERCLGRLQASEDDQAVGEIVRLLVKNGFYSALESGQEAVTMINEGLERVMEVTRGMREFFHPGSDRMELCDINKLLKSTLIVSRYKVQQVAEVETRLTEGLCFTLCYPTQLNQVFLNLIVNAVDAIKETGKRGKIVVSSQVKGEQIILGISDSGPGIPRGNRDKIFTPFFTTKEAGSGVGLGLSMAKKIIEENHGGRIFFKSTRSKGTTFFVHLPLKTARPPGSKNFIVPKKDDDQKDRVVDHRG